MRHQTPVIALSIAAALAGGCAKTDAQATAEWEQGVPAAAKLEKAKAETKEAVQASQDYAYARKAEFEGRMKKDLAEVEGEMDRLAARIERSRGAAKTDARARLEAVRAKWAQARERLDQVGSATESTWDAVKGGVRESYGELESSVEETRKWMSDKIEA